MTNNSKFIEAFKDKARNKQISSADILARCLYKAVKAKGENKEEIATGLIKKAFTEASIKPHRPHPYHAVHLTTYYAERRLRDLRRWEDGKFVTQPSEILPGVMTNEIFNDEELALFKSLLEKVKKLS